MKDTADEPAGNIPVLFTASAFSKHMEETRLVQEGSESGRSQTSQSGTTLFVVNIPPDCNVLEFRVSKIFLKFRISICFIL